ncbi:hypothetical protein DVH24_015451 [Malus domestica]|uniref:Uncharacterized protein n=1 Tax=Malus domestica TaxID=3750 RepID=A0A498HIK5_MALDO|nr:hypothetical protein DVH24_015451 [Malus domestica]
MEFNNAQLAGFRASCFEHLKSVSCQLVHELSFRRVARQGVKYFEELMYLIGDEVTRFTKKDFCLIRRLHCDEPYDIEVEPSNIRLLTKNLVLLERVARGKGRKGKGKTTLKKGSKKVLVTCVELERAFKECKNEDDLWKIGLVYFADGVLIVVKSNVATTWISSTIIHGVQYPLNNYRTTFLLLLLGEGNEEWMVMWKEMRRKRKKANKVRRGRDPDGWWGFGRLCRLNYKGTQATRNGAMMPME